MSKTSNLLLDSCVLLNLLASSKFSEIIVNTPSQVFVSSVVRDESFYMVDENEPEGIVAVDLTAHIDSGLIEVCDVTGPVELQLLVNFSLQLDDGEAHTLAISIARGWDIATDDRKARRVYRENSSSEMQLLSTTHLVKSWAYSNAISEAEISSVVRNIQANARFYPPNADPNKDWWISYL